MLGVIVKVILDLVLIVFVEKVEIKVRVSGINVKELNELEVDCATNAELVYNYNEKPFTVSEIEGLVIFDKVKVEMVFALLRVF